MREPDRVAPRSAARARVAIEPGHVHPRPRAFGAEFAQPPRGRGGGHGVVRPGPDVRRDPDLPRARRGLEPREGARSAGERRFEQRLGAGLDAHRAKKQRPRGLVEGLGDRARKGSRPGELLELGLAPRLVHERAP
ncbi:MAG: hypothetical protein ACK56I_04115, partial [bacterium]